MDTKIKLIAIALFGTILLASQSQRLSAADNIVVGNVRVQLLSDSLARLELKGAEGFEDRKTFHIFNREWPGVKYEIKTNGDIVEIKTANYAVDVPQNAASLAGVELKSSDGKILYRYDSVLKNSVWLPAPSDKPEAWSFADTPRIIPPPWGLTPAPKNNTEHPNFSGWNLGNDAPDVYVFVPGGSYFQLRKDFLKLTGPTEMPPLFAFGAFDSRYYSYSEATALKQIDDYRARQIPLDVLVVDTGWRIGASIGYQPDTNLFPNMTRFFKEAHAKNVRVMFNDHPEPKSANALDPKELNYRSDGLTGLLNEGLDFWWFDRNWSTWLTTPRSNLKKEVWGMRLYHDITQRDRPDSRPLITANVDGIDSGFRNRPMDVAAHRFPIQWTGDIRTGYDVLRRAVENAVYSGACSLFPYECDDLGGHIGDPTPEQYIRWIEYGALSPVYRVHCGHNHVRMPWIFGADAETIARTFLNMRYRLLPVFYAAAHENYETSEPLLRRLDLYYPQYPEARRNDEYLLGKYILVAPMLEGTQKLVPESWIKTPDGKPGLQAEYFTNSDLSGTPAFTRADKNIDFDWKGKKYPKNPTPTEQFSVRWTGSIEIPAGDANSVVLSTEDGVRAWIDGKLVIDAWGLHDSEPTITSADLTAGEPHRLRIEYQQLPDKNGIQFIADIRGGRSIARELWLPPGDWVNAWNGDVISGPAKITNSTPLNQIPLFIKSGAVVPLAPPMQFTGEKPWNPITLDLYPNRETNTATLYEDDTLTTDYQVGKFRDTIISSSADDETKTVNVQIGAAEGSFKGAMKERAWILRIHPPGNWPKNFSAAIIALNGKTVSLPLHKFSRAQTAMPLGDSLGAPDSDVYEFTLPAGKVSKAIQAAIHFEE